MILRSSILEKILYDKASELLMYIQELIENKIRENVSNADTIIKLANLKKYFTFSIPEFLNKDINELIKILDDNHVSYDYEILMKYLDLNFLL